ncbi:IclR family transcriptional regulator [Actinocorallia longicatena]|uniref:IclR family transcriptional regulator n=1 Tax=Actinocorallia longicatena TaxID=111803 RepID=A0ABP6Q7V6_9ACTN
MRPLDGAAVTTGRERIMPSEGAGEPGLVKSAQRALEIMELLGAHREPMSVVELHRRTGYPRSSLHQLVRTLTAMGWVEPTPDGLCVGVGANALLCGTAYLDRDPALPFAGQTLEAVRDKVGYTAHYARLDGARVIYLATREVLRPARATSRIGRQLPAHATALGKILLAELTADELGAVLPGDLAALTEATLTAPDALRRDLERARDRGYATEREENTAGICCVSAAVPYRIPATDAISCSMPAAAATDREIERVAGVLLDQAAGLSARLRREGIR